MSPTTQTGPTTWTARRPERALPNLELDDPDGPDNLDRPDDPDEPFQTVKPDDLDRPDDMDGPNDTDEPDDSDGSNYLDEPDDSDGPNGLEGMSESSDPSRSLARLGHRARPGRQTHPCCRALLDRRVSKFIMNSKHN
ncbi:hypothetical protein DEO72_LG5g2824 [Vigna unguiculata]|uniref:Uncharacterized protein n=1 Tax=Vigna unguiculata TaxID=3917 RepID=A0A4D6M1H9_VIGUN|nr:hypothetical protein DEO72_LG5g2823 [Vigna unguiculata]QCD94738.1 hypothetical protein DEO72_LG5g2824 [Vigna unguiculata]